jgi:hypothetical protein
MKELTQAKACGYTIKKALLKTYSETFHQLPFCHDLTVCLMTSPQTVRFSSYLVFPEFMPML